ncbi:uncharacterized protein BX664DRAFT_385153 [Halteromyces radiatus]|uniref:uncharacterized protein n=1 Tax=Halteromyces radiatus TaxID=101107 RepID=UPI0022205D14|nr:uncharacterized protein BX664DRAFT_385153 [Halteromyces radiatus]KAI8093787.1 hypothetical protein BX664DRAFT_385153 [Halteromyces radiatus]
MPSTLEWLCYPIEVSVSNKIVLLKSASHDRCPGDGISCDSGCNSGRSSWILSIIVWLLIIIVM